MSIDRNLCAICAWRRDCKKKFMQGDSVYCPDFTKDLSIRDKLTSQENPQEMSKKPPKPTRFF
ncbi:MAG TPA: hypothetical protein ENN05_04815 [Deltaproteobacteria bacterium]|nr:hypothetical protein [Deltaproteobacteria bacterium]